MEGRGRRLMTPLEGNMAGASKPVDVFTKQQRIAELARKSPEMSFTNLAHSHRHHLATHEPMR